MKTLEMFQIRRKPSVSRSNSIDTNKSHTQVFISIDHVLHEPGKMHCSLRMPKEEKRFSLARCRGSLEKGGNRSLDVSVGQVCRSDRALAVERA